MCFKIFLYLWAFHPQENDFSKQNEYFLNSNRCSSLYKCKGKILLYVEMSQLSPHIPIVVCFGHNRLLTSSPVRSLLYDFLFNHFCFMTSTNCQQATRGKQTHCPCSQCLLLVSGIFSQAILWSGITVWVFVLVLYGWVYFVTCSCVDKQDK